VTLASRTFAVTRAGEDGVLGTLGLLVEVTVCDSSEVDPSPTELLEVVPAGADDVVDPVL
jgi:hypothetical protein